VSVTLWPHSDLPIWVPFYLDPEDVRNLRLGVIWDFIKGTGLQWLGLQSKGQKGPVKGHRAIGTERSRTHCLVILFN